MTGTSDPTRRDVMAGMAAGAVALSTPAVARTPAWAPAGTVVKLSFVVPPAPVETALTAS